MRWVRKPPKSLLRSLSKVSWSAELNEARDQARPAACAVAKLFDERFEQNVRATGELPPLAYYMSDGWSGLAPSSEVNVTDTSKLVRISLERHEYLSERLVSVRLDQHKNLHTATKAPRSRRMSFKKC